MDLHYAANKQHKTHCTFLTIIALIIGITLLILLIINIINYDNKNNKTIKINIAQPLFITSRTAYLTALKNDTNNFIYKYFFYYGPTNNQYSNTTSAQYTFDNNMTSLITDLQSKHTLLLSSSNRTIKH